MGKPEFTFERVPGRLQWPSAQKAFQWLDANYKPKTLFECSPGHAWKPAEHLPSLGPRWQVTHVDCIDVDLGHDLHRMTCRACGATWVEDAYFE